MVPEKIGGELRARRLQMRLTQADLASRLGVSRAYIGNVEKGVDWEPAAEVLVAWAVELGLDPVEVLRKLGRAPAGDTARALLVAGDLSPAVLSAIRREVAAGVREGVEGVLQELRDPSGGRGSDQPGERPPKLPS